MNNTLETAVGILEAEDRDPNFLDLVRSIMEKTSVDEATAKASILRLSFEGRVGIALDWSVHLCPVESYSKAQLEAVAAA
ncbi:MAG: hypothetical protein WBX38_03005 [Candidatus Sulfotelmatobacter sp.]